ncbi:glutathione S-transferase [Cognatiyoonia sp. IB215182]|uniref:glutathione S-transferase n=1 Tax=Cognatiyoonia sp. IB215182 TaxID=3097353 RepID=UPI002A16476F|nr:glutathione S-transferase [Cognatiyoonia sp. IB215182]MDX8355816.1 glutathione S-transferase [Cognatiyoonia sp. IB215182]
MKYELFLANKVYSGWGLRVWMLLRHFDIQFSQSVIPLYTSEHSAFKTTHLPARQFPTLVVTGPTVRQVIWDSLAICEFLADTHHDKEFWPKDVMVRAAARGLCAEMHSGFKSLRSKMPVNMKRTYRSFQPDEETQADISRICELWAWARNSFPSQGPYLFGHELTVADAFFAPIACRLRTYSIQLTGPEREYCELLLSHPAVDEYVKDAKSEAWILAHNEFDID